MTIDTANGTAYGSADLYTRVRPLLGRWAERVRIGEGDGYGPLGDPAPGPALTGELLVDRDWLADRVADTVARWDCPDLRTAGTLWWYSASVTVVIAWPAAALTGTDGPDMDPQHLRGRLTEYGYLRSLRSARSVPAADSARSHRELCGEIIAGLAAVSGASERALWAIASDSLAGRMVDAVSAGADRGAAHTLTAQIFTAPLIRPRFFDLTADDEGLAAAVPSAVGEPLPTGARRVVRRGSCCLIYQVPGEGGKCRNCPRRTPVEKTEGWTRMLADG